MFERENRLRRHATLEHETRFNEAAERVPQLLLSALGRRGQQFVGEVSTNCGADLCHLLRFRTETVETRHQRGVQRRRNR